MLLTICGIECVYGIVALEDCSLDSFRGVYSSIDLGSV
jgi:hypothetical protein